MTLAAAGNRGERPERVVLFGSEGGFSRAVLQRLLAEGISVAGLVMPGVVKTASRHGELPVAVETADPYSLAGLARSRDVPILRAGASHTQRLASSLSGLAADILLVACFPLHLPRAIWERQKPACWNLHPSLLPRYRGPAPLFWQLRFRESRTGVTLHEVSDRFDAGDIVAQTSRALPADTSAAALDAWVAEVGVALFLEALERYRRGCLVASPQDEAAASYFPQPGGEDRTH